MPGASRSVGNRRTFSLDFLIDGGDAVITTGQKGRLQFGFPGYLDSVRLHSDVAGSIVIDLWKETYANLPATVADTITASAKPTLSTAQTSEDTSLTGWTRAFAVGDWITVVVDSAATLKQVTLSFRGVRTD